MKRFLILEDALKRRMLSSWFSRSGVLLLFIAVFSVACSTRKKVKEPAVSIQTPVISEAPTPEYRIQTANADAIRGVWLTTIYGLDWPSQRATSTADMARQRQ